MHTVVVGGGFAGVKTALELARHQIGRVTLISDRPYFLHHETLYSTATGRSPEESAIALDDIFAPFPEVRVAHDRLVSIDPDRRLAVTSQRSYDYDTLVLALGSEANSPENSPEGHHVFGTRTLEQITALHDHLHQTIAEDHHVDRNYVIVGGGMTGVELAGALGSYIEELAQFYLSKKAKVRLTIVEAADRLLPDMSPQAGQKVHTRLTKLGVQVVTGTRVTRLDDEFITVGNRKIPTKTVLWATGSHNNSFYASHPQYFATAPSGHVVVNPYLEAYRDIYVIGDNIDVRGSGHARGALDMAVFVADHLVRHETGSILREYRAATPIVTVPLGPRWAYVECLGIYVAGRLGARISEHLTYDSYRQIMPKVMADAAMQAHRTKIDYL